jgi:hypothetical protein
MFSIFLRQAETPALPELCLRKQANPGGTGLCACLGQAGRDARSTSRDARSSGSCFVTGRVLVGQASVPVTMQLNKVFPKDTCRLPTAGALGKNGG